MHDIPGIDDPLLRAILEMREFVDGLIDQEKRRVGGWAEEAARDGEPAASAVFGGQRLEGTFATAAVRGETRAGAGDADDPRKRLDALARRLDGRVARPQGPAADGS